MHAWSQEATGTKRRSLSPAVRRERTMGNVQPLGTTSEFPREFGLGNEQGTNRPSLTFLGSKDGTVT